jgi:hypothetical protein
VAFFLCGKSKINNAIQRVTKIIWKLKIMFYISTKLTTIPREANLL